MTNLVFARDGQALTTSLIVANSAGFEHRSVLQLIRKYPEDFVVFGRVAFEMQPFETAGGQQERQVAVLNEGHATLLLTYFKNTETVRKFKVALVKAFYEMREQLHPTLPCDTITPAEQRAIQAAVAKRAKRTASNYQTIYRAIKVRYQIAKYDQLPRSLFEDCLSFIETVELSVPEPVEPTPAKIEPPEQEPKRYTVTENYIERQRTFVYCVRYLFKKEFDRVIELMRLMGSPHAGMLYDAINDLNLALIERDLEKLGFPVSDMPCYKHWLGHQSA